MTNIIQSSRGIDADDAIGSQPVFENATLAGAIQDLTRIARAFEQKHSVPLSPRGDLEYGATRLRRAAQLVEVPLREPLNAEILKIECLADDAKRSLSEYS